MTTLDLDDMLRLRHTSRMFMRIFSVEKAFTKYHLTVQHDRQRYLNTARIWAAPCASFTGQAASFYGNMCDKCSELRRGDVLGARLLQTMPLLYCGRCKEEHREMHFSQLQRQEADDADRMCKGHEGAVYLCSRTTLSFHQLQTMTRRFTGGKTAFSCPDEDHGYGGRLQCQRQLCDHDNKVRAKVYRHSDQKLRLQLSLATHISIKRLPSGNISAHHLQMELEAMRQDTSECDWLPSEALAAADIMRAFDPNICSCLEWGTSRQDPASRSIHWPLCPDPCKEWREPCPPKGHTGLRGRCAGARHGFNIHHLEKDATVDVMRCSDRNDLLVVEQTLTSVVDSACGPGWSRLVSLSSLLFFEEDETLQIFGCGSYDCAATRQERHGSGLRVREAKQAAQHCAEQQQTEMPCESTP